MPNTEFRRRCSKIKYMQLCTQFYACIWYFSLTLSQYFSTVGLLVPDVNKHQRKLKGQSRMDNPEKLTTFSTQDTVRRQAKQKNTTQHVFTNVAGDTILQFLKEIDLYTKIQLYNICSRCMVFIFLMFLLFVQPPSQKVCRGQNRHQVSPPQRHQSSKRGQPRENPGVQKWDRELLRLEGASVSCSGCMNSQPTRPSDET